MRPAVERMGTQEDGMEGFEQAIEQFLVDLKDSGVVCTREQAKVALARYTQTLTTMLLSEMLKSASNGKPLNEVKKMYLDMFDQFDV